MAEIIYPTSSTIYGPWLLDNQKLQTLDKVFDDIWEKLTAYREKQIENVISKKIETNQRQNIETSRKQLEEEVKHSWEFQSYSRILEISFKSGKKLIVTSFKEAAMQKEFENDMAKNFEYTTKCLGIEASFGNSKFSENKFSYSVNSFSSSLEKEIYFELERWAKDNAPKVHLKVWKKINTWILPIYFILLLIWIPSKGKMDKDYFSEEAYKLLEDGIDSTEVVKSIELLLSINSGFEKEFPTSSNSVSEDTRQSSFFILSVFIICLILTFAPNTIIGLGKGEKKLNRTLIWIKIVTYIIPVLIILPILLSKITENL